MQRPCSLLLGVLVLLSCGGAPRRGDTVLFGSGADLQSMNPLLTTHPLARQVQRYVLLTTLARYDSSLTPTPYLARQWTWSIDHRTLTFQLNRGVRWHDGVSTTSGDVVWTLDAARDIRTNYPRRDDLAELLDASAPDDSTAILHFSRPQQQFPDVLTDLAILPRHLLDSVAPERMREAEWNRKPIGNGPFRFESHQSNRRWVFVANPEFPAALGGPPRIKRLVIAVVDDPMTKLAALAAGELDFAGIQPAHAEFVRRDAALRVIDYPLLFDYAIVFNTRRPPFNQLANRRGVSAAIDRQEIVDGYLFGFGSASEADRAVGADTTRKADGAAKTVRDRSALTASSASTKPSALTAPSASSASFELLTVGSGEAALEQMLQAQLARPGFAVTIRQLELSAFLDRVQGPTHDFTAAVMGIPGDLGRGYLTRVARLSGLTPPADRDALTKFFADSMPVAFIYRARGVQGANRRVQGVQMDERGELATVQQWSIASQ